MGGVLAGCDLEKPERGYLSSRRPAQTELTGNIKVFVEKHSRNFLQVLGKVSREMGMLSW